MPRLIKLTTTEVREAEMEKGRNLRLNCLFLRHCWPNTFPYSPPWCDENDYLALTSFSLLHWYEQNGGDMEVPTSIHEEFGWTLESSLAWLMFESPGFLKAKAEVGEEWAKIICYGEKGGDDACPE